MHDIGRMQQEYLGEAQEFGGGPSEFGESESGEVLGEAFEAGLQGSSFGETSMESGSFETFESESTVNEALEMELASELLEISTEDELDHFLGKLISSVGRGIGKVVRSPIGRALGGVLKTVAKRALPIAGGALGSFVGGPVGGMIGSKLASVAGQAFGLELEGMSNEDAEFEVARRFVRLASAAVNHANAAPVSSDPQKIAQSAVTAAARRYAPGLVRGNVLVPAAPDMGAGQYGGTRRRGVWIRRGRKILLLGV
jgi:hypothetical protein